MVFLGTDQVESLQEPLAQNRNIFTWANNITAFTLAITAIIPLFAILFFILIKGFGGLSLDVITNRSVPVTADPFFGLVSTEIVTGIPANLVEPFQKTITTRDTEGNQTQTEAEGIRFTAQYQFEAFVLGEKQTRTIPKGEEGKLLSNEGETVTAELAIQSTGFANSIIGTFIILLIASVISLPGGILTGVYLSEFQRNRPFGRGIRFVLSVLSSTPSIIMGVFAYSIVVLPMKTASAYGGGVALGIIMIPVVAITTEEALKLVPMSYRLGSAGLGCGRFQTIGRLVLKNALPGIMTGVLLALSRAAGETAPLIFTSRNSNFWPSFSPEGLAQPFPFLSVQIYQYAFSPVAKESDQLAWTGSIILLTIVLVGNILSRRFTRRKS